MQSNLPRHARVGTDITDTSYPPLPPVAHVPDQTSTRSSRRVAGLEPEYLGLAAVVEGPLVYALSTQVCEISYDEAVNGPERDRWSQALREELAALVSNGTFILVKREPWMKVLKVKWVFSKKLNSQNQVERFKCRLVAKGFMQRYGLEYDEVYAPVTARTTKRFLLAEVVRSGYHLRQLDVTTAFLNGVLDPEMVVYMEQPEGFEDGGEGMVCHLIKAIYGLKQAPRAWHEEVTRVLCGSLRFGPTPADPALFVRQEKEGEWTYVLTYVDDFLIASKNLLINREIGDACREAGWKLKELGFPQQFLGVDIVNVGEHDPPTEINIHQGSAITRLLHQYNMSQCAPANLPIVKGWEDTVDSSPPVTQNTPYASLVGSLLYISTCTRPDLAYVMQVLTRAMAAPTHAHWELAKRVLRYLKGTKTLGISYTSSVQDPLVGYSDANFAKDKDGGRSVSGFVALRAGGAVSWYARKQSTVAKHSSDAEYQALSAAATEICWLRTLSFDMGLETITVILRGDNQASLCWAKDARSDHKSKHIEVIHHHIREKIKRREIALEYVPTKEQVADLLTKAMQHVDFRRLRDLLGMVSKA